MPAPREIVITGAGVASPLGMGRQAFWNALVSQTSGVGRLTSIPADNLPVRLAAEVRDFDAVQFVKPRKSLKVMARDAQLGMTAAALACEDAGLGPGAVDPERFGVTLGADTINPTIEDAASTYRGCLVAGQLHLELWGTSGMANCFPLSMLKLLPNMIACHISIAHDARGHNNTLYTSDLSGLLAIIEAARTLRRGNVDVMLTGGASSRTQPLDWARSCTYLELSRRNDDPAAASRPFDADRDGQVCGEGAALLVLEDRRHAQARKAKILARVLGWGSSSDAVLNGRGTPGSGLARAITAALRQAGVDPADVGHINAHGASTIEGDRIEAAVLARLLPGAAVTAPKSYFGNLFAAAGAAEALVSVLAVSNAIVPPTLNYEHPDPDCALNVIRGEPLAGAKPLALIVNRTIAGQAAAMVLAAPDWT